MCGPVGGDVVSAEPEAGELNNSTRLLTVEFGYRPFCAVIVDQRLAGGGCGDQCGNGGIVERPRQPKADLV